jgi:hypothetical protein
LRAENDADAGRSFVAAEWHYSDRLLARIIHECRRGTFETEALRRLLTGKAHVGVLTVIEEAEQDKPRRARRSDDVEGIHE